METEKRLIDAKAGKKRFCAISKPAEYNGVIHLVVPISEIDKLPTVDAVEVVRCRDCKKWFRHTEVDRERGECRRYQTTKHEAGYCDRGERKYNE